MQKQLQWVISLTLLFQIFTLSTFAQSWEKVEQISGSGFEDAGAIARDNDGNTYIIGDFDNDITIGSITLTTTATGNTAFIAKLDSNGNALWIKDFNANGFSFFNLRYGIEVDDDCLLDLTREEGVEVLSYFLECFENKIKELNKQKRRL